MISKEVNKENALEGIDERIKEKSKAWVELYLDKLSFETFIKNNPEPTDEEQESYDDTMATLQKQGSEKKREYIFKNIGKEAREIFNKVHKFITVEDGIENANKGMKDLEEFLEICNRVKSEIK